MINMGICADHWPIRVHSCVMYLFKIPLKTFYNNTDTHKMSQWSEDRVRCFLLEILR